MNQIRNIEGLKLNSPFSYAIEKNHSVRKKSNKWLFPIAFLILIAISLSIYSFLSGSLNNSLLLSVFSLKKITVYGVQGTNAELIKQSLSEFSGKNLLTLSSDKVKENISKFGLIEGFLLKKTYPSEITVEIKLKPSTGYIKMKGIFYEIDGAGSFWESCKTPSHYIEVDSNVDISDIDFQTIAQKINEMKITNFVLFLQKKDSDSYIITTRDNIKLIVSGKDFKTQWEKYTKSKSFLRKNFGDGGIADLRWSNRIILTPIEKPIVTEEEKGNG